MNLHQLARALGGEVTAGWARVPAPGHSKADRSLSIRSSHHSADGLYYFSFGSTPWQECRDHVRCAIGLPAWLPTPTHKKAETPKREEQSNTRDLARAMFAETIDPRGTLAEKYLKVERGLGDILDDTLAQTLRFHPRCPFRDGEQLVRAPALICVLRDPQAAMHACSHLEEMDAIERRFLADLRNVLAVQRIRLDDKGRKVERRSLGPLGNGVVFVSSIFESFYSATATIAEGVESALAARKLGFAGVVAITGVARLRTFEPPFIWGSITGIAENDEASESAWRDAAPRWREAGHRVRVVAPPSGDANDYLKGAQHG